MATADPIVAKTIEHTVGLRAGGIDSLHEVLATYSSQTGADEFALCRGGVLLFTSGGGSRFIANVDVARVDLLVDVKTRVWRRGLALTLVGGEKVDLRIDGEDGHFLDVFPVHSYLRRRVHQARRGVGLPGVL